MYCSANRWRSHGASPPSGIVPTSLPLPANTRFIYLRRCLRAARVQTNQDWYPALGNPKLKACHAVDSIHWCFLDYGGMSSSLSSRALLCTRVPPPCGTPFYADEECCGSSNFMHGASSLSRICATVIQKPPTLQLSRQEEAQNASARRHKRAKVTQSD